MEKHVTSLELSKKLKELGVPQKSQFYWTQGTDEYGNYVDHWYVVFHPNGVSSEALAKGWIVSAFLASELGDMLPSEINIPFKNGKPRASNSKLKSYFGNGTEEGYYPVMYTKVGQEYIWIVGENEVEARAKMLIHLIEQKLLDVNSLK